MLLQFNLLPACSAAAVAGRITARADKHAAQGDIFEILFILKGARLVGVIHSGCGNAHHRARKSACNVADRKADSYAGNNAHSLLSHIVGELDALLVLGCARAQSNGLYVLIYTRFYKRLNERRVRHKAFYHGFCARIALFSARSRRTRLPRYGTACLIRILAFVLKRNGVITFARFHITYPP